MAMFDGNIKTTAAKTGNHLQEGPNSTGLPDSKNRGRPLKGVSREKTPHLSFFSLIQLILRHGQFSVLFASATSIYWLADQL